jgi:hypothetical protein
LAIEKEWLLDPTLDQVNKQEWPSSAWVSPAVLRLDDAFWNGGSVRIEYGESSVRYSLYRKQHGFTNTRAARQLYWKPVADRTMDILAGVQFPLDGIKSESTEIENAA